MGEYSFIAVIAGVLLIGAMSPGPSFIVVAQNSLNKSRAHGIVTALGTGLGVSIFAVLASFGVTTLLDSLPSAFLIFKLLGGAYLLFLACRIWANSRAKLAELDIQDEATNSLLKSFFSGLITQISNPKTALVIAGIFAAFVPATPPPNTTVLVAIIAFIIDFSWYAIVALSLSANKSRQMYLRVKTGFDRTAAVFLGAVGIRLLFTTYDG